MTIEKAKKAMDAGLGVLKFSLDAMTEDKIKKIIGKKANYGDSISKILELIKVFFYILKKLSNNELCLIAH